MLRCESEVQNEIRKHWKPANTWKGTVWLGWISLEMAGLDMSNWELFSIFQMSSAHLTPSQRMHMSFPQPYLYFLTKITSRNSPRALPYLSLGVD